MTPLSNFNHIIIIYRNYSPSRIVGWVEHGALPMLNPTHVYKKCYNSLMKYRRIYINGGTYFFTLVTYQRLPVFSSQSSVDLFHEALKYTENRIPFDTMAYVILPDHIHAVWTLPERSCDYSTRWRLVKSYFTRSYNQPSAEAISASRKKKKEQGVWQRRFWEHLIRDEADLLHHVEYIHYNPIKHGYVDSLKDWKDSSFLSYVEEGLYPLSWGENAPSWSASKFME